MKLLGEDSPVSKLQVKLEPGTHSRRAPPWALQTSPRGTSPPPLAAPGWIAAAPGAPSPRKASLRLPQPAPASHGL